MYPSYNLVLCQEDLDDLVRRYEALDEFCIDVETVGDHRGDPRRNRILWVGLGYDNVVDIIPLGHPNGGYLHTDYPLLASGVKRQERGLALRPADYSRDERKATKIFGPPVAQQLEPAEFFAAMKGILLDPDVKKVGHNVGFDVQSITKYLGETPPRPWDTMAGQFILDSRNKIWMGLDDCVKREFNHVLPKGVGKCVENYSFDEVAEYLAGDIHWTWLLHRRNQQRLALEMGNRPYRLDMDVLEVTCSMEMTGANMDQLALADLRDLLDDQLEDAKAAIYKAAGKVFSVNSNAEKQRLLFTDKTAGGRGLKPKILTDGGKAKRKSGQSLSISDYSVSAEALELFRGTDELADALLAYADLNKLMSTYVVPYLGGEVERTTGGKTKIVQRESLMVNGRIHTQFVLTGAETGRFSSRNPNLQNVPNPRTANGKAIRNLFIAPPRHKLIVADYSQIEPRVMASLSGDKRLIDNYLHGRDIYTTIADPLGVDRAGGKVLVLSLAYGVGPDKVAADLGISLKDAKRLLADFEDEFASVYAYKRLVIRAARSRRPTPYVTTLIGRRRYLPDLMLSDTRENYGFRSKAERQAFNTVIQGSAADIIKVAMVRAHRMLPEGASLSLTVHDELVTIARDEVADIAAKAIREAMEGISVLKVPLVADLKVVEKWGDAK